MWRFYDNCVVVATGVAAALHLGYVWGASTRCQPDTRVSAIIEDLFF